MATRTYTSQGATFSPDRRHRYALWRRWATGPTLLWVMLNPSTADEAVLDPTIRRGEDFSKAWGFGGLVVCNLFGLRSTDPMALYRAVKAGDDPIGEANDQAIADEAAEADQVLVAWGRHGHLLDRHRDVLAMLGQVKPGGLKHLGLNSDGTPKHPLYLAAATPAEAWPVQEAVQR